MNKTQAKRNKKKGINSGNADACIEEKLRDILEGKTIPISSNEWKYYSDKRKKCIEKAGGDIGYRVMVGESYYCMLEYKCPFQSWYYIEPQDAVIVIPGCIRRYVENIVLE
ncbi:MAG: hypothetical protein ACOYWZ_14195 [Bacillota bacterium]